ncbi:hypothetical protein COCOBI_05-1500 [Coccomyxa sp. Obi]|nr:hypothetical protein COCOBI_05-1500 [Coccomyxa sp. Obi]
MSCSVRAVLLLIVVGIASGSAAQPVIDQDARTQSLAAQNVKVRVNVRKSNGATASEPDEEDLGQNLVFNLAAKNGQLYKKRLQKSDAGLIEGVATTDAAEMPCGAQCASCNAATGQCTECLDGSVLMMDAASPNQLTCRRCSELNCAEDACTDGFGCSACPLGFGIASTEPPFACTLRCPPNCVDCDDVRRATWRSDDGRCNACAQGYMLTENGFCEEEWMGTSPQQQQSAGLPDVLGSLLSGLLGTAQLQMPKTPSPQQMVREAYLAAAGRRQNIKMGLPLEAAQPGAVSTSGQLEHPGQLAVDIAAATNGQPVTINFGDIDSVALAGPGGPVRPEITDFGDFDSAAFANMQSQVQGAPLEQVASVQLSPVQMIWLQQSPAPAMIGCIHKFLSSLMQSFVPAGVLPGAGDMNADADAASTQDLISSIDALPDQDGETEEEAWLREQGNVPSRMDPEAPQQALQIVSDEALATAEGGTQEVNFRWTSLMNTLLGLAEPASGPSDSSDQGLGEQQAEQELVKLSNPQPLGNAWVGLTASIVRPVGDGSLAAQGTQQDDLGSQTDAATVKLTDTQPLGESWTGLTASMLRRLPDQDVLPDQETDNQAVVVLSEDESREATVSREAVVAAAKELAASTGMSEDAALDRAVSAVLQAGSYAETGLADLSAPSGNRRFGPADAGSAGNAAASAPGDGAAVAMAVPPESGPPDMPRKGVLRRALDDIAGAVKSFTAVLFRNPGGRPTPAVPASAVEATEAELDAASREAAAGAKGGFLAAALGRLQAAAEAAVRARFPATNDDIIARPDRAPAAPAIAYASGRGAGTAGVLNILRQEGERDGAEGSLKMVPDVAVVDEAVAGAEPSLVSDMATPVVQLPGEAVGGRVSANSLNNGILQMEGPNEGAAAAFAYADPSLLS